MPDQLKAHEVMPGQVVPNEARSCQVWTVKWLQMCISKCILKSIRPVIQHVTVAGQQRLGSGNVGSKYILKRIFTERGPKVQLAGLREAYFGRLLQNHTAVLQVLTASASCRSL